MAATITALNVRLGMDASNFSQGANLTRNEVNKIASTMRQSVPASEKYAKEVALLNRAFSQSGRNSRQYANAIDHLRKKHGQAAPAIAATRSSTIGLNSAMLTGVPIVGRFMTALTGPVGAVIALGAGVAIATTKFKAAAERIDVTAKSAKTLGTSYNNLIALQKVASESAGLGTEDVNRAMRMFVRNIAVANADGGKLADTLQGIGLNIGELANMDAVDAFEKIAQAIDGVPEKAEQIRIATELLGRDGARMVEVFRASGTAIEAARKETERLGMTLSDEAVASVEEMNDAMGVARLQFEAIANRATADLAPAMTQVAKLSVEISLAFREQLGLITQLTGQGQQQEGLMETTVQGWRAIVALARDFYTIDGFRMENYKALQKEIAFNRMGLLTEEQQAQKTALEAKRTADQMKITQDATAESYERQVESLRAQRSELNGNHELARQIQLEQQGYNAVQQDAIIAMERHNQAIADQQKKEEEQAAARKKAEEERIQRIKDEAQAKREMHEEAEEAFRAEIETARAAAEAYFEQERDRDKQRRDDIAKGPGAGIEVGSAAAAKFMADQVNRGIAESAVPEKPSPGEDQIIKKTEQLLVAAREEKEREAEKMRIMRDTLIALKETRVRPIR